LLHLALYTYILKSDMLRWFACDAINNYSVHVVYTCDVTDARRQEEELYITPCNYAQLFIIHTFEVCVSSLKTHTQVLLSALSTRTMFSYT
jgi:hypothetical protein